MKRVCLLACCAILSGCMHSAPGEVKKEPAAPAAKQEKPELSAALVEKSIVKGKTTRDELVASLGAPNSVLKHPYHVPKVNTPGTKLQIPPEMIAVETWNYWKVVGMDMPLLVEFYIDETGVILDYRVTDKAATAKESVNSPSPAK